jgi:serralysin
MKIQTDIPGSVSTKSKIAVGGSLSSNIETTAGEDRDEDWIAVKLTSGTTYTFSLTGSGANPLEDPFLKLLDRSGTVIIENDDSGDGSRNSLLVFTPETSGTYYINATSFPGEDPGDYTITVELGDSRIDTPLDAIDGTATVTWDVFGENNTVEVYFAQANDEEFVSLGWT